jgi:hypothetical protein
MTEAEQRAEQRAAADEAFGAIKNPTVEDAEDYMFDVVNRKSTDELKRCLPDGLYDY